MEQLRGSYKRAEVYRAELQRGKKSKLLLFSFKHFFCPLNGGSFGGGGRIFLVAEKMRVEFSRKVLFAKWNDTKTFVVKVFFTIFSDLVWFCLLEW